MTTTTALCLFLAVSASAEGGMRALSGPKGTIWAISLSRDGGLAAAASDVTAPSKDRSASKFLGGELRVWDARTGDVKLVVPTAYQVKAVALSPDGKLLAAPSPDGVALYDVAAGEKTQTFSGELKSIDALAFSRDGRFLISQSSEEGKGELRVRTAQGQHVASFSEPGGAFAAFSASGDGGLLAGSVGKEIRLYDTAAGRLKRAIGGNEDDVRSVALSAGGETLVAPVVFSLKVWDAKTGAPARTINELYTDVAFSGDGRRLAGVINQTIAVLDAKTWREKRVVDMGSIATSFALSDDGALLATGHGGVGAGEVRLWDVGQAPAEAVKKAAQASGPALPAMREFSCDSTKVTQDTLLKAVADGGGDSLMLRPTGEPCRHELIYKDKDGKENVVSKAPGMYVVVFAKRFKAAKGDVQLVCASNISHSRFAANPGKAPRALTRRIDAAPIDCAAAIEGQWGPTATVLSGGSSWAAWVLSLEPGAMGDQVKLRFVHDSTFQFLNSADPARPAEDGVYETTLTLRRGKAPKAGAVSKVSDKVLAIDFAKP